MSTLRMHTYVNVQVYTQKSMFLAFFGQRLSVNLGPQRVIFSFLYKFPITFLNTFLNEFSLDSVVYESI